MKNMEVFMFGNSQIILEKKNIIGDISQKSFGLFSYLLMNNKAFNRERLANLFWKDSSEDAARYNLRYNIWSLRKALEEEKNDSKILICQKDVCQINSSNTYVDVFHLENLIEDLPDQHSEDYIRKLENVKDIYKGEFLEGFYIKNCPEFNDWVFFEREKLQRKYFETLDKLAKVYKLKGNFQNSINNLEEMLKINPLQEELYIRLINVYLDLGDRKTALYQYERCRKILREELNISPMEETRNAYENIRSYKKTTEDIKGLKDEKLNDPYNLIIESRDLDIAEDNSRDTVEIFVPCYSIGDMEYYWMSNLVKEIIKKYDLKELRKLEEYYWNDIYRIENSAIKVIEDMKIEDNLTFKTEKNRIFSATLELITRLISKSYLIINIKDIEFMDTISFQFLKILLFRSKDLNLKIIIKGNKIEENLSFLKEHFQFENFNSQ